MGSSPRSLSLAQHRGNLQHRHRHDDLSHQRRPVREVSP
ncbi:hypothetical protein DB32_005340 [Sandaracinus amylolyticus]|uniref:Uncharacterized protein n=1 Tax=Sandaracinus amylolyticus TaxID=927083 RepID=A0A0F6YLC8_9BACT|nr:hypothetical protein DB32_005340 [Sandaracinus amylolyticus]